MPSMTTVYLSMRILIRGRMPSTATVYLLFDAVIDFHASTEQWLLRIRDARHNRNPIPQSTLPEHRHKQLAEKEVRSRLKFMEVVYTTDSGKFRAEEIMIKPQDIRNHPTNRLYRCYGQQRKPYVLIMDCTYKTNRYKMPLLDIVGVTALNTSFYVGFCFVFKDDADQ